jgi:predicted flap endonuclease-1-like 5' DNA nuclease
LDDFTAIPGVGPVTAQKLHDAGLYTCDDLHAYLQAFDVIPWLPAHTRAKIQAWLGKHLP